MSSEFVFALYKPHQGKDEELKSLIEKHYPTLLECEFVTSRKPILLRSDNGTYIELFEWKDSASARAAHEHPDVADIWEKMATICDFEKLESLEESKKAFPHFKVE